MNTVAMIAGILYIICLILVIPSSDKITEWITGRREK